MTADEKLYETYAARLAGDFTPEQHEQNRRAILDRAHQFSDRSKVDALLALIPEAKP